MSESEKKDENPIETEAATQRVTIDEMGLTAAAQSEDQGFTPKTFLFSWFQLFRTAQIHTLQNKALERPLQNFISGIHKILETDGSVSLQAKDGTLFLNSVKLMLSSIEYTDAAEPVFDFFEQRGMGGFTVEGNLTVEQVHQLLKIMVYSQTKGRTFKTLDAELKASGLPFRINKPLGVKNKGNSEAVLERRGYTFLTYSKLVVLCRDLLAGKKLNPSKRNYLLKKMSRTIESLVDICLEDDHTFLGISSVKSEDAYPPHHAANTAVLSIALGQKLGIGKVDLADLGIAASLCDVGLREVPSEIIEKGEALEPSEREVMEHHNYLSVKFFLEDRHYTKSVLRRIVVAYEHHREVDGGGYPKSPHPMDLFTKIVAIAEAYDSLTTNRPWRKASLPDEALGQMLAESGKKFDPLLLKIFVNTMGLYPIGTLVRLSSGELGVVIFGGMEGDRISRPMVALIDAEGKPSKAIDLMEKDDTGNYLRDITTSEDPGKYGLQPSGLISTSPTE